jgi:hypothetical protein
MKTPVMITVLLTITALTAVAQESTGEQIKKNKKKVGEAVKDAAKTVGEKTKEAAKTVGGKNQRTLERTRRHMPAPIGKRIAKAPGRNLMTLEKKSRS